MLSWRNYGDCVYLSRVWNPQTGTPWPRLGTETKISILDSKTNMFLTLFVLGLYNEVLNKFYQRAKKFRSDFKLFLNSDISFQGVWNPQTRFFLPFLDDKVVVYSTDRSKAVVPVSVKLFVALLFILRGDLFYVLPCVIISCSCVLQNF